MQGRIQERKHPANKMKNIILTLDYELYGNGSGDVFRHIIEPSEKYYALERTTMLKLRFSLK